MRSFPIDDDVVALVSALAHPAPPYESFNDALRRVLAGAPKQIGTGSVADQAAKRRVPSGDELLAELDAISPGVSERRARAPKADLRELVRLGILKEGETLVFVDYKGHPQPKRVATVAGADLAFERKRHSMSALSSLLLKQDGYIADAVRGPDHWAKADGRTIRELWDGVLKAR
jgi:hypothetical protein